MSISNRKESNSNSNQMTNSTQLNELSSSDSNNNNEESESSNLAELETINKYKESLAITSMHQGVPGLGILSPQDGQGRATRVMRRCTTDENSLALHNHNGLEGKKKLSVVLIALVDQLAAAYEEDEERRKLFSQEICKSLIKLDLIHPTFLLQQMEGLRAQYSVAFQKLVHIARDKLPRNRNTLPALLGPDHRLAVSVIKLHNLYKLSRYKEEFIEEGKLGHGGFGVVYRAKNKLDNATYAVKKVFVKISKEELVLKIFREVTVFARVSHSNIVGYKNAWLEPCVMNTSDGLVNSNSSNASGSSPSSPVIESESPSSGQQEDPDSFSIQFAAEVSNNNKQNQYQFHYIRSAHNSLQNGKVVSEMSNIITSENRNIVFDTNEPNDDLNVEKEDSLLQRGIGVPHINKQTKKAKVQILEELNGTPPEWSEMERVIGLPRRLSDTNNTSFDFQNSLFLQEAVNRSRGGKIRLAADATNSSMNRKSKFWLGAGDTNSSQLISEPPSDSNFVDSDSDNCKAVISYKTREAVKPQLQLECAVLYIQMDLCSQTLREWLDERNESERQIDENECFPIFQQLLQAVAYLHEEKGILHRDIKPRNIFINPGLQVKLGDFGLAKDDLLRSATPQSTTPVDILHQAAFSPSTAPMDHTLGVGTQGYASPEQLTSSRVTQYSDMYSLGIVLFELYTKFGTNMERVDALTHLREKGITNIGTETNERILSLVSSLMNPVPELRPSARQLLQGYFSDCQLEKLERQQLTEEISALKLERDSLQNSLDIITKAKDAECASQKHTLEKQLQQMRALQDDMLVQEAEIQKMREQVTRQGAELADKTSLLNSKETEILYLRKLLKECGGRDPRI